MFQKKIENILQKHDYEFFHTKTTKSTMQDVRNYLKDYKENCFYLSDQQSKGKGQRGSNWYSPPGNIYCSISFDNFLDIKEHFLFSVLISLSIKMSLEKFNAKNIYFKWPNDIFYKKNKFAGMISEIININEKKSYIIVGFGINFISAPQLKNYQATYIKSFCNLKSINDFLLVFIKILFSNLQVLKKGKKNKLMEVFSKSLMFIDKKVTIVFSNSSSQDGIFRGVNDDGSLKLETEYKIENIYNGSIKL
jgi:BirA family biotin operon repressor/biotin-[acetyl-CoA-carboxylase] ligase